jgi:putative endonuclease
MKLAHNYYVYIVECSDSAYYIGVTNDLEGRIQQHNDGISKGCFTYARRPVVLKYAEHFRNIKAAIAYEKQLKGWSRKKKEALFIDDIEGLKKLSQSYSNPSPGSG